MVSTVVKQETNTEVRLKTYYVLSNEWYKWWVTDRSVNANNCSLFGCRQNRVLSIIWSAWLQWPSVISYTFGMCLQKSLTVTESWITWSSEFWRKGAKQSAPNKSSNGSKVRPKVTIVCIHLFYWYLFAIKGCFDAMERKYLKQLTLGIYTDPSEPDELIEAYTFRFSYDSNQFNCNISLYSYIYFIYLWIY